MTKVRKGVIRQGDVLIIPIDNTKISGKKLFHLRLAEGEVTGHSHRISNGQAELYERDGVLYLQVISPRVTLKHEEHRALEIPHGTWMIRIQREYQPIKTEIRTSSYCLSRSIFSPPLKLNNSRPVPNHQLSSSNDSSSLSNLSTELRQLAPQVNADYWQKLVTDTKKGQQYLEQFRLQKKQTGNQAEKVNRARIVSKKIKFVDKSCRDISSDLIAYLQPKPLSQELIKKI